MGEILSIFYHDDAFYFNYKNIPNTPNILYSLNFINNIFIKPEPVVNPLVQDIFFPEIVNIQKNPDDTQRIPHNIFPYITNYKFLYPVIFAIYQENNIEKYYILNTK